MPNAAKSSARLLANALPIYRVYRGAATAERLRTDMADPTDRTWQFAGRVTFDASTDFVDGRFAAFAGPTKLGGYLDQLADKAWFLQITRQLYLNGELDGIHVALPAVRDLAFLAIRPVAGHYGLNTDAKLAGKAKMWAQTGAVISACSPLADAHPAFIKGLFTAATAASVGSGAEMLIGYANEISDQYNQQPIAQFVTTLTVQAMPILKAA